MRMMIILESDAGMYTRKKEIPVLLSGYIPSHFFHMGKDFNLILVLSAENGCGFTEMGMDSRNQV